MAFIERELVTGCHFYSGPPRLPAHDAFSHLGISYPDGSTRVGTDPEGKDWGRVLAEQVYIPFAEQDLYTAVTFNVFGTLFPHELNRIEKTYPDLAESIRHVKEKIKTGLAENGVGTPYIHTILPDLSLIDKRIVVSAGKKLFMEQSNGVEPQFFWPPETALDNETLMVLAEFGYKGVLCATEQVEYMDGTPTEGEPVMVYLGNKKQILAVPFNGTISRSFAFEDKHDANIFTNQFIAPNFEGKKRHIAYADGETFGHHWPGGEKFLNYLQRVALPACGITPLSINKVDFSDVVACGRVKERTAWSCPHGDLVRWHGECGCTQGDKRWKEPFYAAHHELNGSLTYIAYDILTQNKGQRHFINLIADNFSQGIDDHGSLNAANPFQSIISAKVSSLIAVSSCGSFFGDPHTSGHMNVVYALQAIQHVRDAGFIKTADELEADYRKTMSKMKDPTREGKTGVDLIDELLSSAQN